MLDPQPLKLDPLTSLKKVRSPYFNKDLIKVLFLPPNTTLLQLLDISVNNLVKKKLRQVWVSNFSKDDLSLISRKIMAERVNQTCKSFNLQQIDSGFRKTSLIVQSEEFMQIEWNQY